MSEWFVISRTYYLPLRWTQVDGGDIQYPAYMTALIREYLCF
jgi:hypothetical protein